MKRWIKKWGMWVFAGIVLGGWVAFDIVSNYIPPEQITSIPIEDLVVQKSWVMFVIKLIVFIICMAISFLMTPEADEGKSATLDDMNVPTAEVGRAIPVVFGTKFVQAANVVWYGDFKSHAYKK